MPEREKVHGGVHAETLGGPEVLGTSNESVHPEAGVEADVVTDADVVEAARLVLGQRMAHLGRGPLVEHRPHQTNPDRHRSLPFLVWSPCPRRPYPTGRSRGADWRSISSAHTARRTNPPTRALLR
jgi:hypothetical protein